MDKHTILLEKEVLPQTEVKTQVEQTFLPKTDLVLENKTETVLDKPNFDKIESLPKEKKQRLLKLSKQEEEKKSYKVSTKLKLAICAIIFCLLGSICIYNAVSISNVTSSIEATQNEYNASLGQLIQKINSTETGNKVLDLFETYPEENFSPSSFHKQSNWFDRLCNFLAGLFGG